MEVRARCYTTFKFMRESVGQLVIITLGIITCHIPSKPHKDKDSMQEQQKKEQMQHMKLKWNRSPQLIVALYEQTQQSKHDVINELYDYHAHMEVHADVLMDVYLEQPQQFRAPNMVLTKSSFIKFKPTIILVPQSRLRSVEGPTLGMSQTIDEGRGMSSKNIYKVLDIERGWGVWKKQKLEMEE